MPLDLSAVDRLVQALAQQNTPPPRQNKSIGIAPYAAMIGGHGVDAVSTLDGWKRGNRETNPLIGNSPTRLMIAKGAGTLGAALLMRLLDQKEHDTAAKWIGYGTGAAMGAVGARNFSIGRRK